MKSLTALSASRISTAKSCSWKYWAIYHLKLPEKTNTGALMGTVCHTLFECLGNPRHSKHYNTIVKNQSIDESPACARMIKRGLYKVGIKDDENLHLVKSMCLNGLNYDFKANKYEKKYGVADLEESEEAFDITVEKPHAKFRVKGFIDKLWLFKNKTCALIRDFKSSKKMYAPKEFEENLQNFIYTLAVKHIYPTVIKQRVEFLFLRFDLHSGDGVMHGIDITDDDILGLEMFLDSVQKYVDEFNEETATKDYAKNKPYPTDGSFGGPLMCGRARFEGDLKKDGVSPQYFCPFKFAFDYYSLIDCKTGKPLASAFEEEAVRLFEKQAELAALPEPVRTEVVTKTYGGCPAWKK